MSAPPPSFPQGSAVESRDSFLTNESRAASLPILQRQTPSTPPPPPPTLPPPPSLPPPVTNLPEPEAPPELDQAERVGLKELAMDQALLRLRNIRTKINNSSAQPIGLDFKAWNTSVGKSCSKTVIFSDNVLTAWTQRNSR